VIAPTLSASQNEAVATAVAAVRDGVRVFRIFGYAGTGKTTIAKEIARQVEAECGGPAIFAAYTGKAASVLKSKGCAARTIHQILYKPREVIEDVAVLDANGDPVLDAEGKPVTKQVESVAFDASDVARSGARRASVLIIDECSMVDEAIGRDLMGLGVPIIVLGDPFQLPPVNGGGFFTNCDADIILTEVHRQQEGCGVLDIAWAIREGRRLQHGEYEGGSEVVHRGCAYNPEFLLGFDQVICGTNKTRATLNRIMRTKLLGQAASDPIASKDRLVCLRNNYEFGIANGELMTVRETHGPLGTSRHLASLAVDGREDDEPGKVRTLNIHHILGLPGQVTREGRDVLIVDYGYAITAHKAQGSQWDRVLVVDESAVFRQDAARWLYTAVTRAAKSVVVAR
jgi:exodeoxyribonuclease-5